MFNGYIYHMQTVLITGGTGLIGKNLCRHLLEKGYSLIILTRSINDKINSERVTFAQWDIKKQIIDINAIRSADIIIHLAGAGVVDKRWTDAYKKEIVESRTQSSKLLIETLNNNPNKVQCIVSASAVGWYGPDKEKDTYFNEADQPSNDFLGQTCFFWEQTISAATNKKIRV